MPRVTRSYLVGKRALDLTILLLALPFALLLAGAIALAIKVDTRGPIVFRQQRTGQHGRRFGMYKFRTMVANAEELKAELALRVEEGVNAQLEAFDLDALKAAVRREGEQAARGAIDGKALAQQARSTLDSALRHWRGRGGAWKGRTLEQNPHHG